MKPSWDDAPRFAQFLCRMNGGLYVFVRTKREAEMYDFWERRP